jgi:hypothetical protein
MGKALRIEGGDGRNENCIVLRHRALIEALPALADEWEALRAASLRFLGTPWFGTALRAGWDELEIWGCFPSPRMEVVKRRGDSLGLAPALTLGMGCSIESIDERQAVVTRARTGSRLVHRRALPGRQWAVPWWTVIATTLEHAA